MATELRVWGQVLGFGIFAWLGFYLIARRTRRSALTVASAISLFGQAAYFASGAIEEGSPTIERLVALERWFWWASVVPIAAWFWFSAIVAATLGETCQANRRLATIWAGAVGASAIALSIAGSLSSVFMRFDQPILLPNGAQTLGPGPLYWLYGVFVIAAAAAALVNLLRARAAARQVESLRAALGSLIAGGAAFLVGALILAIRFALGLAFDAVVGYGWIVLGALVGGIGIARLGLLLDGQNVRRDLLASFSEMLALQAAYLLPLGLAGGLSNLHLVMLVGLVALSHTALDRGRGLIDRVFFSRAERTARAESRQYATALGIGPVAVTPDAPDQPPIADGRPEPPSAAPKAFKDAVRRAISALKNPPQLAQSPLLTEPFVAAQLAANAAEDNRLNRVAALRGVLTAQIEGLRPPGEHGTGESWRFYNVLYLPYVREIGRKDAVNELRRLRDQRRGGDEAESAQEDLLAWLAAVDEDTYYKWQRRASDMIAANLWEQSQTGAAARSATQPRFPG